MIVQCSKEGLPTNGTETELKNRHQAFVTLVNSEADSIQPRTLKQLVDEIKHRERLRKQESASGNSQADSVALKQMLENGRTSGDREFDKKMSTGFSSLIDGLRKRMGKKSSKEDQDDVTPNLDNTNGANSTCDESNSNMESDNKLGEVTVPPSDAVFSNGNGNGTSEPVMKPAELSNDTTTTNPTSINGEGTRPQPSNKAVGTLPPKNNVGNVLQPPVSNGRKRRAQPPQLPTTERSKRSRSSLTGPWNCGRCTFYNAKHTWASANCEVCMNPRP